MKAYELLKDKKSWTTGAYGRDKKGVESLNINRPYIVSFCAVGAIKMCYPSEQVSTLCNLIEANVGVPIRGWNDSNTYEVVIAKLKELDI